MSSRFYFGDDSNTPPKASAPDHSRDYNSHSYSDNESDNDTTTLPFPKPLSRPSFLTTTFEPHAFLASLSTSNRFQTLEDLQSELRDLSASINKELVDLVNANYESFVSLGADLRGGDEKVEEIRVGLLGFEKEVRGLRERVVERRREVEELVARKREIRKEVGVGRGLLEIEERLTELEGVVGLKERRRSVVEVVERDEEEEGAKWSEGWDEESVGISDEEFEDEDLVSGKARVLVDKYLILKVLVKKIDPAHPFLVAQRERLQRVQDRVRTEIETAVVGADELTVKQKLIQMRTQMDE